MNSSRGSEVERGGIPELQTSNDNGSTTQSIRSHNKSRRANLTVLASFLLTFTGCGLNFAFGTYQELYLRENTGPFEGAGPAEIDLIGTLAISLMTIGAPFASAWTKSYTPRSVTLIGGALFAVSNILASLGQKLWHFLLTQGLMLGCATCLSYIPAVTVTPGWFDARRGLAMGIVLSGTGVGGVVWAPALRALNASIGFRNTLRLTGVVTYVLISGSALILKWDPDSERRNQQESSSATRPHPLRVPLVNWQVARSRKFLAQAIGATLQAGAYYAPVYFFSAYARTLGYSAASGANFIALSNGSSAAGKVIIGYIADRYGRLNLLLVCTLISSAATLGLWLPSTIAGGDRSGKAMFAAFAILYGIFAGAYVALFPTALVELFGVQHFASVNGFLYMLRGIASLVGTPVAGALIRGSGVSSSMYSSMAYEKSSALVGALLGGATLAMLWVRLEAMEHAGWKWKC